MIMIISFSSPFLKLDNRVYTVYNYSFILFVLLLPQLLKIKFRGKETPNNNKFSFTMHLFPAFYLILTGTRQFTGVFIILFSMLCLLSISYRMKK